MPKPEDPRDARAAVSLFAGAGGLDIAAHMAGFHSAVAVELEPVFCDSLEANKFLAQATSGDFDAWFDSVAPRMGRASARDLKLMRERMLPAVGQPNAMAGTSIICGDVGSVKSEDVIRISGRKAGEIELLIGGPPCQSFSMSGKRAGLDDARGKLFLEFARFVRDLRPRFFLFENVKGLTHMAGVVARAECPTCGEFQPGFEEASLGEAPYTCPKCGQKRGRLVSQVPDKRGTLQIIVNELESLGYELHQQVVNAKDFGAAQSRERIFIIGSRDHEKLRPLKPTHGPSAGEVDLFGDGALKPYRTVWDELFSKANPYHDWPLDPDRAVLWVKNVVRPHAEPVTWDLRQISPTIGAHQAAKLAIAPRGVPEEQLARQQWHTLGRRQGDTPPVHVDHSMLSDEDCLALQTFPRDWALVGPNLKRKFQIGNAVPPSLGAAVLGRLPD